MRILLLTDSFKEGGAERVASLIVKGLIDQGHEVHLCIFINENNYGIDSSKVTLHLLSPKQYPYALNVFVRMKNLAKTIKRVKPQVIYSFGPIMASYVVIASKLANMREHIKIVSSERNDPRQEPASNLKKIVRDLCYSRSDVVVCQTSMAVELLKSRGIKTDFVIIPNPISPELPIWEGKNSKNIITAARLTEQKNLPLLINAFYRIHRDYPDYRLVIYGEGPLRNQLETIIRELNLTDVVTMPGFAKDIHHIMAKSFMYVSSSDYEGISNSMLEALGIGLPCVCTDCPVGGAAMYINNGYTGLLTKVGDEDALYMAMKKLIDEPGLRQSLSAESVNIKTKLSLDKITQMWVNLIKQ